MYPVFSLLLLFFISPCLTLASEDYEELLTVRPLRDGRVATRFLFTISQLDASHEMHNDQTQHYALLPLTLGQVLRDYSVTEVHLSLNAGKWDYGNWGMPEDPAVSTGAELWAWIEGSEQTGVNERWKSLRNALAGLFCASVGSLDEMRTTSPVYAFRPEGNLPISLASFSQNQTEKKDHDYELRHASLPAEHVCTENLTPFLKLLPCKGSSGIASLLNPHKLFDADWHGMSVHVTRTEDEGIKLQLSFQAVIDPVRSSPQGKRDFSFQSLFGRTISRICRVASTSSVKVTLPQRVAYAISPEPPSVFTQNQAQVATFDLSYEDGHIQELKQRPLDISVRYPTENSFSYSLDELQTPMSDLRVMRSLSGTSQAHGKLGVSIQNNREQDIELLYLETMPWLLTFFLHTLQVRKDGADRPDLLTVLSYKLPEEHGRPSLLEVRVLIPAGAIVKLDMEVEKSFLRYTEHPPDAQRGWDLPPAVFIPLYSSLQTNNFISSSEMYLNERRQRVYSPAVLVDVATPDFSMPYNVIIMSSTLIALIFGSIFNLMTRRFVMIWEPKANVQAGTVTLNDGGSNETTT